MLITLKHITKYYGAKLILKDVGLKVEDRDRIGLIGVNGAGKSTLLNIIYGSLEFEEGTRSVSNGVTLGFLRQNSGLNVENTILGEMNSVFSTALAAMARLEEVHQEIQALPDHSSEVYTGLAAELTELEAIIAAADGYQIPVRVATVLNGMGFAGWDWETKIASMSGGEKTRLALCKLLLESPDLLILDEPTNHLDFKTLLWLEEYLKSYPGALLIVSHDRYFLDALVTSVCELDRTVLTRYPGNYTRFLTLKEEYQTRQWKMYEAQQEEIARLQDYVDRNIVRATTSKSAKSKRKAIEHMELVEKPNPPLKPAKIRFTYEAEPVKDVLSVENLRLSVGEGENRKQLLSGFDFAVTRGEKIAVIGANGIGKSSFLKAIQGILPVDGGKVEWGRNVRVGYYEQETRNLNDNKTVLDELWDRHKSKYEVEIRTILGGLLFTGEDVYKRVASLSGGERAKLKFAILEMEHSNFLLLDEPTNHLDLSTKEALDKALAEFTGTLLMVSHDRYLLSKVPTKIVEMDESGATVYPGNYEAYLAATQKRQQAQQPATKMEQSSQPEREEESGYHRSKKERARQVQHKQMLREAEETIATLEAEIVALEQDLATPEVTGDYQRLMELTALLEAKNGELETAYQQWYQLQEQS